VLYNDNDSNVVINEFFHKDSSFSVLNELPLIIPAKDSVSIRVEFSSETNGTYSDKLNIRSVGDDEMIAKQVLLTGSRINLIPPIEPPTNLIATKINNEINLTWEDNSNNETGFVIDRKQGDSSGTNNFITIDSTTANDTSYSDNLLQDTINYTYRIYAFNNDTVSSFSNYATVSIISSAEYNNNIEEYLLFQNYPNPFNPSTNISYQIPKSGFVSLILYSMLGERVKTLVNRFQNEGKYSVRFDASDLPSGVYFYQLKTNQFLGVRKLILIK
jgi:hypothetical protein